MPPVHLVGAVGQHQHDPLGSTPAMPGDRPNSGTRPPS
jgi:hypothetical protein